MAAEKKIPRTPVTQDEFAPIRPGVEVVATKGDEASRRGKSTLFFHPGLGIWSVTFVTMPNSMVTWLAFPNEQIARGAYAGGPPYDDPNQKGG